ncbi:hypothetical protein GCM10009133_16150 [Cocleimonas flava]|uniref:Uncharacterized protein DUF4124 n=1 Tax=Cocleimonas flava TaxID=634765 RepID=A0A4V2P862_9GAMM|nr:DUF4124 domain-containing protein [Cocleimonas flava]TCJ84545.1 uncharacterized protein DUF4124 [Cocleimonas flava]
MRIRKLCLYLSSIVFLITISFQALAGLYRWVDDNGKVHFSDKIPASAILLKKGLNKQLNKQTGDTHHSHSGRSHSHPLPVQGVQHQHNGGAVGSSSSSQTSGELRQRNDTNDYLNNFLSIHNNYCRKEFDNKEALNEFLKNSPELSLAKDFKGVYEFKKHEISYAVSPVDDGCTIDVMIHTPNDIELFSFEEINKALIDLGYVETGEPVPRKDAAIDDSELTIIEKKYVSPKGEITVLDFPLEKKDKYYMTLFTEKFSSETNNISTQVNLESKQKKLDYIKTLETSERDDTLLSTYENEDELVSFFESKIKELKGNKKILNKQVTVLKTKILSLESKSKSITDEASYMKNSKKIFNINKTIKQYIEAIGDTDKKIIDINYDYKKDLARYKILTE